MASRKYLKSKREKRKCAEKVKYPDLKAAQAAAYALGQKNGYPARAYRCPGKHGEPRHFHITSNKPSGRL